MADVGEDEPGLQPASLEPRPVGRPDVSRGRARHGEREEPGPHPEQHVVIDEAPGDAEVPLVEGEARVRTVRFAQPAADDPHGSQVRDGTEPPSVNVPSRAGENSEVG